VKQYIFIVIFVVFRLSQKKTKQKDNFRSFCSSCNSSMLTWRCPVGAC